MNKSPGRPRRGRPTGQSDARERILEAARTRFLAEGYQAVTMRAIAADAGVDVALVSYYFDSKQGVFGAALALPVNPLDLIIEVLAAPDDQVVPQLLRTFLTVWDDPMSGRPLQAIAIAAAGDGNLSRLVREVIEREIQARVAERIGGPDAAERAGAFVLNMAGLIFARYVFRFEPIASMPIDAVVARLAPVLDVALWGSRGSGGQPRPSGIHA